MSGNMFQTYEEHTSNVSKSNKQDAFESYQLDQVLYKDQNPINFRIPHQTFDQDPLGPQDLEKQLSEDILDDQVTPLPLVQKGVYSLVSDIKLGWRPKESKKVKYANEVPPVVAFKYPDEVYNMTSSSPSAQNRTSNLNAFSSGNTPSFENRRRISNSGLLGENQMQRKSDQKVDELMNQHQQQVVYQGFRPRDSLEIHESFRQKFYSFDFPQYQNLKKPVNQPMQQILETDLNLDKAPLVFDSFFEGGNLDRVVKLNDFNYDLYLRPDTNTKGYCNWFYFKVTFNHKYFEAQAAGGSGSTLIGTQEQRMTYKFNILNMYKKFQLYCIDQKPVTKSKQKSESPQAKFMQSHWTKDGISNVKYSLSKLNNPSIKRKKQYQLSFNYKFDYLQDEVYFAYSIPYTQSQLQQDIEHYKLIQRKLYNNEDAIFDSTPLCKSLSGLTIPLITITDFQDRKLEQKKIIIINGRVHPGESHSSWIVHGFIIALLQKDELARQLRSKFIFKIIPMINPDGVVFGNFRTCFLGKDMNRMFFANQDSQPDGEKIDERLIPEITAVRKLLSYCKAMDQGNKILAFFDVHQHSKRKGVFLYGPQYPLHNKMYLMVRILPKIISQYSEMFRIYSCRYLNVDYKENCARIFIEREFGIQYSYCIECSQQGYMSRQRQIVDFNEKNLSQFGRTLAESILQFGVLLETQAKLQEQKAQYKIMKEQQKLENLRQQQLKRNQNSFKIKISEKRQGLIIKSLTKSSSQSRIQNTKKFKEDQQELSFQEKPKSSGLIGGISNLGNLSLNDYLSMLNDYTETDDKDINSQNQEMMKNLQDYDQMEAEQEQLDDEENGQISSAGSDSEDEEFSKEDQEQLYREILGKLGRHEIGSKDSRQQQLKKHSIRISLGTQNLEEEQQQNTQGDDQSVLSSRFQQQQQKLKQNHMIDHQQVKSIVAQQISSSSNFYKNQSNQLQQQQQQINTSFNSLTNDGISFVGSKYNQVLPIKQYEFGQKFKKTYGSQNRHLINAQLNNSSSLFPVQKSMQISNSNSNQSSRAQTPSQFYPHVLNSSNRQSSSNAQTRQYLNNQQQQYLFHSTNYNQQHLLPSQNKYDPQNSNTNDFYQSSDQQQQQKIQQLQQLLIDQKKKIKNNDKDGGGVGFLAKSQSQKQIVMSNKIYMPSESFEKRVSKAQGINQQNNFKEDQEYDYAFGPIEGLPDILVVDTDGRNQNSRQIGNLIKIKIVMENDKMRGTNSKRYKSSQITPKSIIQSITNDYQMNNQFQQKQKKPRQYLQLLRQQQVDINKSTSQNQLIGSNDNSSASINESQQLHSSNINKLQNPSIYISNPVKHRKSQSLQQTLMINQQKYNHILNQNLNTSSAVNIDLDQVNQLESNAINVVNAFDREKQIQDTSHQQYQDNGVRLNSKIRLFNDSLFRDNKLKNEYMKLKELRTRIKKKQEILQKINDKIQSPSQQNLIDKNSYPLFKQKQANYNSNSILSSPQQQSNIVVFNPKNYVGLFQKNNNTSNNTKSMKNSPSVFKSEKVAKREGGLFNLQPSSFNLQNKQK